MKRITFLSFLLLLLAVVSVSCSDPSLNDYITEFKGQMPEDLGNGFSMTDISIVDDYVLLDCAADETEFELGNPLVQAIAPAIAESLKSMFVDNPDMTDFMQACSDEGKGFYVVAKGTKTGGTLDLFKATPEEIRAKFPPKTKE